MLKKLILIFLTIYLFVSCCFFLLIAFLFINYSTHTYNYNKLNLLKIFYLNNRIIKMISFTFLLIIV